MQSQKGNVLIALTLIILVFVAGLYIGKTQNNKKTNSKVSEENKSLVSNTTPAPTPNVTALGNGKFVYKSVKIPSSYKAYTIEYPSGWKLEVNKDLTMTSLSKNSHSIKIWQVIVGGSGCKFEGEAVEPFEADYRNTPYTELESGIGTLRRVEGVSNIANLLNFTFCAKHSNSREFLVQSEIGSIYYEASPKFDPQILKEMDQIIMTLKAVPD